MKHFEYMGSDGQKKKMSSLGPITVAAIKAQETFRTSTRRNLPERIVTPERALTGYQRYLQLSAPLESLWWGFDSPPSTFESFCLRMHYQLQEETPDARP